MPPSLLRRSLVPQDVDLSLTPLLTQCPAKMLSKYLNVESSALEVSILLFTSLFVYTDV
jgi:hypothetical protein